jgi:RNA polymerase sigma factor (TIGR02999 family)
MSDHQEREQDRERHWDQEGAAAPGPVTQLLDQIATGPEAARKSAIDQLLPLVYDELHRLARSYFQRERTDHTLQPTALVHEAYLRLVDQQAPMESRGHFLALAATQMRRILLDHARRHQAERRGGNDQKLQLEDTLVIADEAPGRRGDEAELIDLISLDSALDQLNRLDPQLVHMVELRYFAGLSIEETARILKISTATVKRGWASARAFLKREMTGDAHAMDNAAEPSGGE